MRLFISMSVVVLLTAPIITGCSSNNQPANVTVKSNNSSPSTTGAPPDNVRRVTITELRDALEQGKAIVIDVRGDTSYNQEHIKGAMDIPETQLVSRIGELPKDKLIVLYCS